MAPVEEQDSSTPHPGQVCLDSTVSQLGTSLRFPWGQESAPGTHPATAHTAFGCCALSEAPVLIQPASHVPIHINYTLVKCLKAQGIPLADGQHTCGLCPLQVTH